MRDITLCDRTGQEKTISVPVGSVAYWTKRTLELVWGVAFAITPTDEENVPYLGFIRQPDTALVMAELVK